MKIVFYKKNSFMIAVWYLGRYFFLVSFLFSSEFRLLRRILTVDIFVYYCDRLEKTTYIIRGDKPLYLYY